jgi:hypothetical protein
MPIAGASTAANAHHPADWNRNGPDAVFLNAG